MNGFPGIVVEHLYVKFGDSCIRFSDRYRAKKQTNTQTLLKTVPPPPASVRVDISTIH